MARARVHQHVNPLARYFRELEVEPLDPSRVYEKPGINLHIDIGCGRGRFLLKLAEQAKDWNFLGLEIREPLVEDANKLRRERGVKNLHYIFCSAPVHLGRVLSNTPVEQVKFISIQFPDPWFKKRHAKRRMVNRELLKFISDHLAADGQVLVQTDVEELAEDMDEQFGEAGFAGEKLKDNILPVKTEREISVENRGIPVFRSIYRKGF